VAAFAALAWARLPVFDLESEALLQRAELESQSTGLLALLGGAAPVLDVLAGVEEAVQLSFPRGEDDALADGSDGAASSSSLNFRGECVVGSERTPGGHCNFFAAIDNGLRIWRTRGVYFEDVLRAFRPITDQKLVLFRYVGDELVQVIPRHSHLDAEYGAAEPACLAQAILDVLAQTDLPHFDFVLSHGDLPILRKVAGQPPFYGPTDWEARSPAPLFSICSSDDFWDVLFPNVCRPSLVNMSRMSPLPWHKKRKVALWRGTDRGAVNWAKQIRDMYQGSPRKRFLDTWGSLDAFDLAFLEDDLLNASVVNTDPSFIPLTSWPEWRYLLDLPGNGYSGSLKQKLTSSSAVLLLTDVGVEGATPVYEHYHFGLQDRVHVLHISMDNVGDKVQWARSHDGAMRRIARNANEYMRSFQEHTRCYIWRLLSEYGELLRYEPAHTSVSAFGVGVSVQTYQVHRRPLRREAARFRARCQELLEEHSQ